MMTESDFDIKEFTRTETRDESPQRRALFFCLNMLVMFCAHTLIYFPLATVLASTGLFSRWGVIALCIVYGVTIAHCFRVYNKRKYRWIKMQVTFTRKVSRPLSSP